MLLAAVVMLLCSSPLRAQADLAVQAQRGKQAMAEKQFADAAAIYAEISRALPNDAGMRMNLGMALALSGRPDEAVPHLERAVKLQPGLAAAWLFLGMSRLDLGEPSKAVPALRSVVAAEPGNARARELLGEALLALDNYGEAAAAFRAVTERQPENSRGWYGLGRSYEGLTRAAFAGLEAIDGGSPFVLMLQADAFAASGDTSKAEQLRQQAIERRSDLRAAPDCGSQAKSLAPRPECEFLAGRYASVVQMTRNGRTAASRYWLIRAYNELAREAFGRLSALPVSPELHQFRAEVHSRSGRHQEAAGELRSALTLVPDDLGLQKDLAAALYRAKSYDEAVTVLERVTVRDRSADSHFLLGDVLLITGRSTDAIPILEKAVALDPALLVARASLGRAYVQTGKPDAAIPHLKAALEIDEDGSLHYQLARAYQSTGRPELAKQMLAKYAAMQKARQR